jgi:hypothetical protein
MVRKILPRMRFPHIDDKKLKSLGAILVIKLCQWRNLPHKRRSSDAAELKQYMFFAFEIV